jgi:LysR family transcriptional regulator, glycine cleavage system transcriptional activator
MNQPLRAHWLPALGAFASAARHHSFARAGEELHLTAAAISHHVRKLEAALGVALFQRQPRGVTLTAEGRRLADAAHNALGELDEAIAQLLRARQAPCVRLSSLPSLTSAWLVPRLPRFVDAHPGIRIHLDSDRGLARFDEGGVDLALRYGLGVWPGLAAHWLMGDTLIAAAAPALIERHGIESVADVARLPLIADLSPQSWPDWFRAAGQRRVRLAEMHSFSDAADALAAAVGGVGAVLARQRLAEDLLVDGRLQRLPGPSVPARFSYFLVHPAQRPPSEPAARFIEWLQAEAARDEAARGQVESPPPERPL